MDADLKEMRTETTEQANEFIKVNKFMQDCVKLAKSNNMSKRSNGRYLKSKAEEYATSHNGNFGELFIAELDLVYWDRVAEEFVNVT